MLTIFLFSSCATYYQKSYEFQGQFAQGNLEQAQAFLLKQKKAEEKKDRLLYFLDRGVVEQMLGNYEVSNEYFEKAYLYNQNYQSNFGSDLLSTFANPMLKPYKAEDFELVLINYYKAINYIQLNKLDAALVEIRRINISLNELNDRYGEKKNRYKEDAFALNLMGIVYEAKGEYNDAFIAYRNAFEAYQNIYAKDFNVQPPQQLKVDLLRMAKVNGFKTDLARYEKDFGMVAELKQANEGDLVFFWLNGLGPVKSEFSLNLVSTGNGGGGFVFANAEQGFSIPFIPPVNNNNQQGIEKVKVVRLAIPKYQTRKPLVNQAYLEVNNQKVNLEKVEDINSIAYAALQDRMLRELGKSVSRLVVKQATEMLAREKSEDLGALVSVLNAVTEKADTRNWQTLPNSIYYERITLPADSHAVKLVTKGQQIPSQTLDFKVVIKPNKTTFRTFHSLESTPPFEQ